MSMLQILMSAVPFHRVDSTLTAQTLKEVTHVNVISVSHMMLSTLMTAVRK